MTKSIPAGERCGAVFAPPSKSQAHRLLLAAALGKSPVALQLGTLSEDVAATAACLRVMGATIQERADGAWQVEPMQEVPTAPCHLFCGESGATLRFLLPVAGALGINAVFHREGHLVNRPLAPLDEELVRHGIHLAYRGADVACAGRLSCGDYTLPGNISSQFISGLLFALPLLDGDSTLTVTGAVESAAYLAMTEAALQQAGITVSKEGSRYRIPGRQTYCLPSPLQVEGDWSGAAFFLCGGALTRRGITVAGLNPRSAQGDRAVYTILRQFGAEVIEREDAVTVRRGTLRGIQIDARPIPDLIPALSVLGAVAEGETLIHHAERLRLKESDRLTGTARMLAALGAEVTELADGLLIRGKPRLSGGSVDCCHDHRIAMAAAIAAMAAETPITVTECECVAKSYPAFWQDFEALRGETP